MNTISQWRSLGSISAPRVTLFSLAVGVVLLSACLAADEEALGESPGAVQELSVRFGADHEWETQLDQFWRQGDVYTIDLEELLVRPDREPIVAEVELVDLVQENDRHYGVFRYWLGQEILFTLTVDSLTLHRIRAMERYPMMGFYVVAVIDQVGLSEIPDFYERRFWARGELLDLLVR